MAESWVVAGRHPAGDTVAWSVAAPPVLEAAALATARRAELAPPRVFRAAPLEQHWRRLSYSSLVRFRAADGAADDRAREERYREGRDFTDGFAGTLPLDLLSDLPLAAFPGGTEPGSFVHAVLEVLDFRTLRERGGRRRELRPLLEEEGRRYGVVDPAQLDLLARELPRVLATPLGAAAGGIALAALDEGDRLDELAFDLPLRGGDRHDPRVHGLVWPREFEAALCQPRPAGSPVPRDYLDRVAGGELPLPPMVGFLTGSIDLAYRVGRGPDQRWYVCDYKTNRLGEEGPDGRHRCTAAHYAQAWLAREMAHHHYFIQYHLYLVALHRYLRQRLPGYDYDRNMGGAVYLFLRGMQGPETAPGTAVFVDRPPREVVGRLDRLFEAALD